MNKDRRDLIRLLELVIGIVFVSAGIVPLVQWFVFDNVSSITAQVFRHPTGAMVWVWPLIVSIVTFAILCWLDTRMKAATEDEP